MKKILFVCLGNICRSPAAEGIMQSYVNEASLGDVIYCDSAGTSSLHRGHRADKRMREHASRRGYDLKSISRPVISSDFEEFDFIIAMDNSNFNNLQNLCSKKEHLHKIKRMCDYGQKFQEEEVPDPYYDGEEGFEFVLDLLEDTCRVFLTKIKEDLK